MELSQEWQDHPIVEWLRKNDLPLNRENFLGIEYLGDVPPDLDESTLPPPLRITGKPTQDAG